MLISARYQLILQDHAHGASASHKVLLFIPQPTSRYQTTLLGLRGENNLPTVTTWPRVEPATYILFNTTSKWQKRSDYIIMTNCICSISAKLHKQIWPRQNTIYYKYHHLKLYIYMLYNVWNGMLSLYSKSPHHWATSTVHCYILYRQVGVAAVDCIVTVNRQMSTVCVSSSQHYTAYWYHTSQCLSGSLLGLALHTADSLRSSLLWFTIGLWQ